MPSSASDNVVFTTSRLEDVVKQATHILQQAGIDTPELDGRWLIGDTLKLNRTQLFTQSDRLLTPSEMSSLAQAITQRIQHKSVARILGEREFWGLPFGLNEATLEPRPDSETLIEATLNHLPNKQARLRLLDLGTGTGCLLLSLLHALPQATGLGVDISERAVQQATKNAERLQLKERGHFIVNNWLENIEESFDVIISNPPYIVTTVIPTLMPEVRDYDPRQALDGGRDGLDAYRHLIPKLTSVLKPGGLVVLEIGYDQAGWVASSLASQNMSVSVRQDLGGVDRCIVGTKSP